MSYGHRLLSRRFFSIYRYLTYHISVSFMSCMYMKEANCKEFGRLNHNGLVRVHT